MLKRKKPKRAGAKMNKKWFLNFAWLIINISGIPSEEIQIPILLS